MTLRSDADDYLEPVLRVFRGSLRANLEGHLTSAYLEGAAQVVSYGRTILEDRPIFYEGPPIEQATRFARDRSASMVTKIDDTTRERMRGIIEKSIRNKRGVPGLMRDLRGELTEMSKTRAETIARTETSDALEEAFMERTKEMGVTGKRVVVHEIGDYPCEICDANADEGDVPIDHVFQSGHVRPPFHPNCVCALAPVMLEGKR